MPALPMRGPSDMAVGDADHENASLDEMDEVMEEEEEDMAAEHASDEEEDVPPARHAKAPLPPSLSRGPHHIQPETDSSGLGIQFCASTEAGPSTSDAQRAIAYLTTSEAAVTQATPVLVARKPASAAPSVDYFNSKAPERPGTRQDPVRTPRPGDYNDGVVVPQTVPMPHDSPRPGLYSQASKSMVDLMSISRKQTEKELLGTEKKPSGVPDYATANTRDTPHPVAGPSTAAQTATAPLRWRRSVPMYTTSTEPPPYPSVSPLRNPSPIVPREEEGKEKLPPYTNHIYLAAVMPRKMEFTAPGFQARDRKWKRALCILEGTMLKIYRVHNGVVEDWWERTVGVGDKTSIDPVALGPSGAIRVSAIREADRQRTDPVKGTDPPQSESSTENPPASPNHSTSTSNVPSTSSRSRISHFLHPRRSDKHEQQTSPNASRSRMSLDIAREDSSHLQGVRRQSMDSMRGPSPSPTTSTSVVSSTRRGSRNSSSDESVPTSRSPSTLSRQSSLQNQPPAVSHFSMLSSCDHMPVQEPDPKDLLRKYTLQHAESGLASDYTKRKNVIRVRMEGEQFLLQARDVPAVIEWIEVAALSSARKRF